MNYVHIAKFVATLLGCEPAAGLENRVRRLMETNASRSLLTYGDWLLLVLQDMLKEEGYVAVLANEDGEVDE